LYIQCVIKYDKLFNIQFNCYLLLRRIYFNFPQFRNEIGDYIITSITNLAKFQGQNEWNKSLESRQFSYYLLINDKILSKKIKEFIKDKCKIDSLDNDEMNKLADVAMRLPVLDVSYKIYSLDQNTLERIYDRPVIENSDVQISVTLTKYNDVNNNLVVYSRYPKIKNCRWFIIIGNVKTNEVLAFEKIGFKGKRNKIINFTAPKEIDEDSIRLYIMSDSYFGLDQEYNINLKQINKGIMDKYGIIEIKKNKKEEEDKKKTKDDEDVEKETQKGDDEEEDEEDLYLENW
jgi:hypothetical protein